MIKWKVLNDDSTLLVEEGENDISERDFCGFENIEGQLIKKQNDPRCITDKKKKEDEKNTWKKTTDVINEPESSIIDPIPLAREPDVAKLPIAYLSQNGATVIRSNRLFSLDYLKNRVNGAHTTESPSELIIEGGVWMTGTPLTDDDLVSKGRTDIKKVKIDKGNGSVQVWYNVNKEHPDVLILKLVMV